MVQSFADMRWDLLEVIIIIIIFFLQANCHRPNKNMVTRRNDVARKQDRATMA